MPLQTGSHLFRQYFCVISSALLALMQPRIIILLAPCFTVRIMHSLWWQSLHQICRTLSESDKFILISSDQRMRSHVASSQCWNCVFSHRSYYIFLFVKSLIFQIYFFPCKVMRQTCIYTQPISPKLIKFWWSKVILYMCLYKMFSVYIITLIGNLRYFSYALTITGFLTFVNDHRCIYFCCIEFPLWGPDYQYIFSEVLLKDDTIFFNLFFKWYCTGAYSLLSYTVLSKHCSAFVSNSSDKIKITLII